MKPSNRDLSVPREIISRCAIEYVCKMVEYMRMQDSKTPHPKRSEFWAPIPNSVKMEGQALFVIFSNVL